jgi:hypothetical protein
MPADYCFRLDDNQSIRPSRPHSPKHHPEHAIEEVQCRSWMLSFQHRDLLAESEDFEGSIRAATEEHAYRGDQCKQQI